MLEKSLLLVIPGHVSSVGVPRICGTSEILLRLTELTTAARMGCVIDFYVHTIKKTIMTITTEETNRIANLKLHPV